MVYRTIAYVEYLCTYNIGIVLTPKAGPFMLSPKYLRYSLERRDYLWYRIVPSLRYHT